MPKVLRIINRFNLGGITYNVSYLSKFLPSEYETLLIGGPEEDGEESSLYITKKLGLNPTVIPELKRELSFKNDRAAYRKIKQIIKEFKPDIVHTHASKAGAIGRLAAINCRVPVIVHTFHGHVFHSYFGKLKTWIFKMIERYLAKRTTAIVAISNIQKKELTEQFHICSPEQTRVINLGFDLERFTTDQEVKRKTFRDKYNIGNDELAIGIIGRLVPIKNHGLFIDAIEYAASKTSRKIRAFIIGDGEEKRKLMRYVESKNLFYTEKEGDKKQFTFTSWITEVDVALAGLDLVALTSLNEGTPVSLIEAQAAGKFIVTTNVGGVADILHPYSGFLCNIEEPMQFCEKLLEAVNNFEQLHKNADSGRSEVIERYSYKRLVSDMDQLYRHLLKKL